MILYKKIYEYKFNNQTYIIKNIHSLKLYF